MGNQPSGWMAPPYLREVDIIEASYVIQSVPDGVFPLVLGVTAHALGGIAWANNANVFLKLSSPMTDIRAFLTTGAFPFAMLNMNVTDLAPGGVPYTAFTSVILDLVTADFTPATMTWNNQGALPYHLIYGGNNRAILNIGNPVTGNTYSVQCLSIFPRFWPVYVGAPVYGIRVSLGTFPPPGGLGWVTADLGIPTGALSTVLGL